MPRYKVIVEYAGHAFHGMQIQPNVITVQEELNHAISAFFNQEISIRFAGRTDAGVHATGQVIDFYTESERDDNNILRGINFHIRTLDLRCIAFEVVSDEFHSRFDAKMRHYTYKIINRTVQLSINRATHCHIKKPLDISLMLEAGKSFIGTHDFSAFRNPQCQANSPIRSIDRFEIDSYGIGNGAHEIHIHFSGKSFLHSMVRKMVGGLILVGVGDQKTSYIKKMLSKGDKKVVPSILPHGLYLAKVDY
ncbi:tRNA pseudouridine(38-40) synthase TruA [Rickettsiales bacterium]|nr:tRNA pseudouridine(38-40) synthase TruA [Rickettsiales bacterium]